MAQFHEAFLPQASLYEDICHDSVFRTIMHREHWEQLSITVQFLHTKVPVYDCFMRPATGLCCVVNVSCAGRLQMVSSTTVSLDTTLHLFTWLVGNQCSKLPLECSTVMMGQDPRLPGKVYKERNVFKLVGDILPKALLSDARQWPGEPAIVFLVCEPVSWVNSTKVPLLDAWE